jgi:hypothetical protein
MSRSELNGHPESGVEQKVGNTSLRKSAETVLIEDVVQGDPTIVGT